jgi:Ca2+-binding RTX toxin-like protein
MPPSQFSSTVESAVAPNGGAYGLEIVGLSNGGVVMAWANFASVSWQLADSTGRLIGSGSIPPPISTNLIPMTTFYGAAPEVAATLDGGFVMTWPVAFDALLRPPFGIPSPPMFLVVRDVYTWRYDPGHPMPGPGGATSGFDNDGAQGEPAVAVLGSGQSVILYSENGAIRMQRSGAGSPTTINLTGAGDPGITALAGGGFVATWNTHLGILGRMFDGNGVPLGGEFVVGAAQVAALASGGFVVASQVGADVKGRRFDSDGNPVGDAFDLGGATAAAQTAPHIASYPGGGFVAVWLEGAGVAGQIMARVFADDGTATTEPFVVNWATDQTEESPEVTVLTDGSIQVIWLTSGSSGEIRKRTFVPGTDVGDVAGTNGADILTGDAGDNILAGLGGPDRLIGGDGSDTASYAASTSLVIVDLAGGVGGGDIYSSIENVIGSSFEDVLAGDGGANRLDGRAGADAINGRDGDDLLTGGIGADALEGGNGSDTASYDDNWGAVFVNLGLGQGFGNAAQGDTYSGIENVAGSAYADTLIGGGGANRLDGNDGDDLLVGGVGADMLNGGGGSDTASYEDNWGAVFINLSLGRGFGNAAEGDVLNGIENVTGSGYADGLLGDAGANRLNGALGSDLLVGHGGADRFVFDSAPGAANLDTILDFAPGEDKILLDNAVFSGLGEGALGLAAFIVGTRSRLPGNRIVYDQETGALYYDADGFGGDPAVQFATLANRPALTGADFLVI